MGVVDTVNNEVQYIITCCDSIRGATITLDIHKTNQLELARLCRGPKPEALRQAFAPV